MILAYLEADTSICLIVSCFKTRECFISGTRILKWIFEGCTVRLRASCRKNYVKEGTCKNVWEILLLMRKSLLNRLAKF